MYSGVMFTKADKKFLKTNFVTKDDLKVQKTEILDAVDDKLLNQKVEILDAVDNRLIKQKEQILEAVDGKLVKLKEGIVKDVGEYIADSIVPMFDKQDKRISRIEKKFDLPLLAD
ncbi:hypothetical protein HY947_04855 [Candidatus Gottesmanbacteria bacterium]|nr:hypothetical protein [Candidatus Gottesmanbacteria bacterium]